MEIHQNIISRITGSFDLFIFIFPNILYVVPFLKKSGKCFLLPSSCGKHSFPKECALALGNQ